MAPGNHYILKVLLSDSMCAMWRTKLWKILNGMVAAMAEKRKYEADTLCGCSS